MIAGFGFSPMAPTLVRPPFHRDGWIYEEKVDGWRMLAYRDGARVRLISRNGVDHTSRFRELTAAIDKLKADVVVLDGEVAGLRREAREPLPPARRLRHRHSLHASGLHRLRPPSVRNPGATWWNVEVLED